MPEWIPARWDVVLHIPSNRRALVMTSPASPKEIIELPEGLDVRPVLCKILLGSEIVEEIDVSTLSAL